MRPHSFFFMPSQNADARSLLELGGRPVMSSAQIMRLNEQIMSMTAIDMFKVEVTHTARVITRVSNNKVLASDDGDEVQLSITAKQGGRGAVTFFTNQITESTLRDLVHRCETLARQQYGTEEEIMHVPMVQDEYVPVALWHEPTIHAMHTTRNVVIPAMVDGVTRHGLQAAGFVGLMARVQAILTKDGIRAFCEETDSEVTVTARTDDGKSSGWAGQAARDWSTIDYAKVAEDAAQMALIGKGPQALEPGRRTAILGPAAVAQIARFMAFQFDANATDFGGTGFSRPGGGNKLKQRVFDTRIQMSSDPADPEGGYVNHVGGFANRKMTWVENGTLRNLAYGWLYAMQKGKAYCEQPYSLRIGGGPSSIEAMIASCANGIYVNRFSNVDLVDMRSGMMTGMTRDGCFLVKDGKINRPLKSFRFLESPFFMFNRLEALGPTARAPFGYTPPSVPFESMEMTWPRRPMIVPPMMVRDFNFASLSDAI